MFTNILLDKLPQITPTGLKIRTDFRESIKFEMLMQDRNLSKEKKIKLALNLYFYDLKQIKDLDSAIDDIIWFYSGGKEKGIKKKNKKSDSKKNKKQIYSYEFDDIYIYSAFLEQYKIDLNEVKNLHWWKFKAMIEGLNENVQFVKIMGYRSIDLAKIKDKEKKEHYKEMQKIYALPDMRTEEEKEADFADALW